MFVLRSLRPFCVSILILCGWLGFQVDLSHDLVAGKQRNFVWLEALN